MKQLMDTVDRASVSPVAAGQEPGGNPTATEVLEVQRQAKLVAGLTISAAAMLEWKLGWQRLWILLRHWFAPEGTRIEGGQEVQEYRSTNVERSIEGEGVGRRVTVPTPTRQLPSAEEVFDLEEGCAPARRLLPPHAAEDRGEDPLPRP